MKIQEEFLNAVDRQDVEKLREIHIKYGPKRKQPGLMQGGSICEYFYYTLFELLGSLFKYFSHFIRTGRLYM